MARSRQHSDTGAHATKMASAIFAGRIISTALLGVALILVARLLGPCAYGAYVLAISVAGVFGAFGDFGISSTINKFVPEFRHRRDNSAIASMLSNGFSIIMLFGAIITIVMVLFGSFSANYFAGSKNSCSPSYTPVIIVAAFTILTSMLFTTAYTALVGFGKGSAAMGTLIIQSAVQSTVAIALALLGLGAYAPILAIVLGFAVGMSISLYLLLKTISARLPAPTWKQMKATLSFSMPIALYGFSSGLLVNIAPVVLGLFASAAVIGYFGVALKALLLVNTLISSMSIALLPMVSSVVNSRYSKKMHIGAVYSASIYNTLIFLAPLFLFIAALASPFVYTLFGATYAAASPLVAIMSVGALISIFGIFASIVLISTNKVKQLALYGIIATMAVVVPSPAVAKLFGSIGLSILMFLIAPIISSAMLVYAMRRAMSMELHAGKIFNVVIAAIISALLILPLYLVIPNFILLLAAALLEQLAIYPLLLVCTHAVGDAEIKRINVLFAGIPVISNMVTMLTGYASFLLSKVSA